MDHWPPLSNVDVKRRRVIVPDTNHLEWVDVHVERVVAAIRLVAINLNLVFISMCREWQDGGVQPCEKKVSHPYIYASSRCWKRIHPASVLGKAWASIRDTLYLPLFHDPKGDVSDKVVFGAKGLLVYLIRWIRGTVRERPARGVENHIKLLVRRRWATACKVWHVAWPFWQCGRQPRRLLRAADNKRGKHPVVDVGVWLKVSLIRCIRVRHNVVATCCCAPHCDVYSRARAKQRPLVWQRSLQVDAVFCNNIHIAWRSVRVSPSGCVARAGGGGGERAIAAAEAVVAGACGAAHRCVLDNPKRNVSTDARANKPKQLVLGRLHHCCQGWLVHAVHQNVAVSIVGVVKKRWVWSEHVASVLGNHHVVDVWVGISIHSVGIKAEVLQHEDFSLPFN